jgi:hypothetical protein
MTTDDKLLLADLERIASDVEDSRSLEEFEEYEHLDERLKITAIDLVNALNSVRRASRELATFRERLERRLR